MNYTYTITFSECVENHVGMVKEGSIASEGFSKRDLKRAKRRLQNMHIKCQLVNLGNLIDDSSYDAYVLVIRDGARDILGIEDAANVLLEEQRNIEYDTKYYDRRRQKVLNKRARHNVCFSDEAQEADYERGRGTIVSFSDTPLLNKLRKSLPDYLGDKASDLKAEGNYYYDINKCCINMHNDLERKRVVGLRLGATLPLYFQWYQNSEQIGDLCEIELEHGDIYVMSEKATGNDGRRRLIPTLKHAAGIPKVLKINI